MNPAQAMKIVSEATAQLSMNRRDHLAVMQALEVLAEATGVNAAPVAGPLAAPAAEEAK